MRLIPTSELKSSDQQDAWSWKGHLLVFGILLLLSLGPRLLSAQDARIEGLRVQSSVVADYKRAGRLYLEHFSSFFTVDSPLNNPDLLSHPPGYSLLWALVFKSGGADPAMRVIQILCDLAAVFVLFLIAGKLLPRSVALISATLVALAPQFTWNAAILLPDTMAVLPLLLAVYFLIVAAKRQLKWAALVSGILIGVSCWLRPNAVLLAPFSCLLMPFIFTDNRFYYAALIIFGALLVIAPITIRNAVVFRHFVPLSLGAGQTMLEGIGDYDREGRFGIPNTDIEIMREEAEAFGRPEYADTLFGTDGIARDRIRLTRALTVISSHPIWFATVMARRGVSMFRLERAPIIQPDPPSSYPLHQPSQTWTRIPRRVLRSIQTLFITAVSLPLLLLGLIVLLSARRWRTLLILLLVPAYYVCFQSALHTEYRYVLALQYFLFIIIATGIWFLGNQTKRLLQRVSSGSSARP